MTRDRQRKRNVILGAMLVGAVIVVGLLMCLPKYSWPILVIAWICSIALAVAAVLPARKASLRAAKLVTQWLAVANLLGTVILTYPYWSEWLEGRFFHGTIVSMCMYGLLDAGWVSVVIAAVFTTASLYRLSQLLLLVSGFVVITLVCKWLLIMAVGMEPFHNRMGLGMEIFASVPNLVIDGLLILSATASTVAALALRSSSSSHVEWQRR